MVFIKLYKKLCCDVLAVNLVCDLRHIFAGDICAVGLRLLIFQFETVEDR